MINLMDEAEKKKITIDREGLEAELGIPVGPSLPQKPVEGHGELKDAIHQ